MAVNLASKYSNKVDERFKLGSLTEVAVNRDYDWVGVNAINVYSVPTVAMNNYTRTGSARYGTAAELDNNVQTMTLTRDRSFTFTIDRGNQDDTMMVMNAGKALARQIDEIIVPEIDTYRLAAMQAAAVADGGTNATPAAVTSSNAYQVFLAGTERMDNNKVPQASRYCFATPSYINFLKQTTDFMKNTEIAQEMLVKGQVGMVDGVKIIKVPTSYFPANTAFILCHPSATVAAQKLEDYKIHENPPGINGFLVEGRKRYDAFILNNKVKALYAYQTA